ncbi:MAG: hypothetical protein BGO68_02480 [Candidatus Amoebophilus sp. 36-38]|nr:MAG: hypothetical protein BGO68_02480 [Candidatus Amoebophilus sp. 36-38]
MLIKFPSINQILRLLVGTVFVFSGLIKLNDPIEFSLTIQTYFQGFAIDFSSLFLLLIPYSLLIAISVCVVEIILGVALLLKFELKLVIRALFLLTGFFTLLTLYTLWFDRVDSCGCLSSAIPLTPRQSFTKNILLLLALHLLNKHSRHITYQRYASLTLVYLILIGIFSIGIGWYTSSRLPIIDFGPYQVGSNISMLIQPSSISQHKYGLEKDKSILETGSANPTGKPKVTNFTIWDEKKEITQEVLEGSKLICIVHKPSNLNEKDKAILQAFVDNILSPLESLWLLPLHEEKEGLPPFIMNHIAWGSAGLLRSMMRADLGFLLLQNGVVIGKWGYKDLVKVKSHLIKLGFYKLTV